MCECGRWFEDATCLVEIVDHDSVVLEALGHTPEADDGDCTTGIYCTACGELLIAGNTSHTGGTATCTEQAKCDVCGTAYGELAPHTWTAEYTAEDADAEKHYHVCTVCGAKDAGEAHVWNVEAATEETDKHCEVCGYVAEEQLGHVHAGTLVPGVDPTCTEAGNKAYYVCECGRWFEDATCLVEIVDHSSVVLAALGHTPEADDGDCTTGIHCSVCGVELTPGNASHTGGTATCTEQAKCEVCGTAYGELAPHTWTVEYTAEDADAEKHYHVCTVCGAKDAGEAHVWNVEAATEETDKHCEVCGYVAEEQLGHVHAGTLVPGVDPTCTEAGNKAYYVCECGKWFEDAACTVEIVDHTSITLSPLDHDPQLQGAKDATETEAGYTGDLVCARCGEVLEKGKEIPVLEGTDTTKTPETTSEATSGSKPQTNNPQTGDRDVLLLCAVLLISCSSMVGIVVYRKRRNVQ